MAHFEKRDEGVTFAGSYEPLVKMFSMRVKPPLAAPDSSNKRNAGIQNEICVEFPDESNSRED